MPWIFLCLMMANAVYFGLKFVESGQNRHQPLVFAEEQLGKPIALLSERPRSAVVQKPAQEPAEEPVPSAEPAITGLRQCYNVGPFADVGTMQQWAEQLRGKRFTVTFETRRAEVKDYWVFIPPFTNRERAEDRLRELKSRGIDGFIVNQGQFINAISLNRFSKRELAQSFLQKMQAAGVVVEYRENTQSVSENWLNAAPGTANVELKSTIDAFLSKKPEIRRENTACSE